ncbi:MAG: hypothetical protein ACLP1X_12905 [Polyangiaceae bacterium]|jgi:hypothetical protein
MLTHVCKACHRPYDPNAHEDSHYMEPPYDYAEGVQDCCLACWLGVGPTDFPDTRYTSDGPLD